LIRAVVAAVVATVGAGRDKGYTMVLLAGEGYASTMTVRFHLPAAATSGRDAEDVVMPLPDFAAAGEDKISTDIAGTVVVAGVSLERKFEKMDEEGGVEEEEEEEEGA
jgi:hypothetical protein